ncbi:MAG: hypothetical protein OSA99_17390 [Acidimicrobiales bacterium]|nr:hypothetical protein [Acidimicrobiales bacterium]
MLSDVVTEAARWFDDLAAFVAPDGTTTTYAELHERSGRVAAGLAEHVVAVADDVLGERAVAHIVPADPSSPATLADLRAHLDDRIATYKFPEAVNIVDEIPLTPMQKVDRRRLATMDVELT